MPSAMPPDDLGPALALGVDDADLLVDGLDVDDTRPVVSVVPVLALVVRMPSPVTGQGRVAPQNGEYHDPDEMTSHGRSSSDAFIRIHVRKVRR
jgi:hypothetical protein